ncbi:MAG TPA: hypothetical protein VKM93_20845 [Terriglobia bacterium]|nr:hypothetical protein [Terriglobia bacterium]
MQETETEVMVAGTVAVTAADPDLVESCVDVAVIVAVPPAAGVKTPALLTVPILVGPTDHVTEGLKLPVPTTVGVQVDVWVVRMDAGAQATEMEVMVAGTVTVTTVDPDLVESCVDVAVIVAAPPAAGVKTPALLTVPTLVGLTDHVTEELKLPVPTTVGVQVDVWPV